MKEIKFRVWYSGRMLDVGKIEFFDNAIHVNDELVVKPENIMQYTGLKDKNGKEIYDGDIVRLSDEDNSEHEITSVRYLNGGFVIEWDNHFNGGDSDLTTVGWAGYDGCVIEVIGNIYENPELL